MANTQPYRFKTITEYHRVLGLPKPEHPLISLIDVSSFTPPAIEGPFSVVFDFYIISLKRNLDPLKQWKENYASLFSISLISKKY